MAFLTILPALVTAAAGLFSSLSSIGAGKREAKRKKELMNYEDKIADENYSKQLADQRQLIAEDRLYNSIGAQIGRAREAGISPLAALGASSGNSIGASTPSQSSPTPPAQTSDSLTMVASSLSSAISQMMQTQMMQKQMAKIDAETANVALQNVKQRFENVISEIEANGYKDKYKLTFDTLVQELREKASKADISEQELNFLIDSYEDRLQNIKTDIGLKESQTGLASEQAEDLVKTRSSRIASREATANYHNALSRTENAFRDLRKTILSHDSDIRKNEVVSSFVNSIVDSWTAYCIQRDGETPPKSQVDSIIGLLKRTVFGTDKQTYHKLNFANQDLGFVGLLANVFGQDVSVPNSFLDWYRSLQQ